MTYRKRFVTEAERCDLSDRAARRPSARPDTFPCMQGIIADADGDIAALVYATGDRPDLVLRDFAQHLTNRSKRICGLIQFRGPASHGFHRRVVTLDDWKLDEVAARPLGRGRHYHIDDDWLDRLATRVKTSIEAGVEAVIVNRFGPIEAAGRGFCGAIHAASERNTPLVIAVPDFEFERWTRFSSGMTVALDCRLDRVLEWWHGVSADRAAPATIKLTCCELFK